jgi:hypothetical protein
MVALLSWKPLDVYMEAPSVNFDWESCDQVEVSDDVVEDLAKEIAHICSELLVDCDEDPDERLMCFLEGSHVGECAAPVCLS